MNTSSYFERPSLEASGTILPWRFIALSGDNKAAQAGNASELVMGISHEAGREAPIPNLASNPTAILDDEFAYYGGGETTFLQMAAAHPFGTKLVPDANGKGRVAAAGELAYAIQLRANATADEYMPVQLFMGGERQS